jgi:hypothetical protein
MPDDCIVDYDNLLKKSYSEMGGIYNIDNSLHHDDLIKIANNFTSYFIDIKVSSPFIVVLKTIAYHLQSCFIVMAKNEIYDFFITSYKFLATHLDKTKSNQEGPKSNSMIVDNVIFEICNDMLNNYDKYDDTIKIQIPNLLVDIVTILFLKVDPYGKKVSIFQIKPYYVSKKECLLNKEYFYPSKISIAEGTEPLVENINTKCPNNPKEENVKPGKAIEVNSTPDTVLSHKDFMRRDMLFKINQITKRDSDSIERSLSSLPEKEIRKLYDICNNYNKIVKYNNFDNLKDFKSELENELKRPLTEKQIRHSQISIKKVHFYMENILDGKFEPHLTHGINHVKHNFEYGYRLAGLLRNAKSGIGKKVGT